jgi:integral membrane protein
MNAINKALTRFESMQAFTEKDAWFLFKLAAIGEACGWTLLISGILCKQYITIGNNIPVLIAGQVHGMLFLIYIVAVVVLYSNLKWSRKRMIIAGIASVPPYGSLIFEQWAAYKRRSDALKTYREITVRAVVVKDDGLLAIQPKDSGYWHLPGGLIREGETVEMALKNLVSEQLGVVPELDSVLYIEQSRHKKTEQITLYFRVNNPDDFSKNNLLNAVKTLHKIDEIAFIQPENNDALLPEFLRRVAIIAHTRQKNPQTVII